MLDGNIQDIDKQVCVTETQAVQNSASIENFTDALKVARQAFAASNLVTVFLYTTEVLSLSLVTNKY